MRGVKGARNDGDENHHGRTGEEPGERSGTGRLLRVDGGRLRVGWNDDGLFDTGEHAQTGRLGVIDIQQSPIGVVLLAIVVEIDGGGGQSELALDLLERPREGEHRAVTAGRLLGQGDREYPHK